MKGIYLCVVAFAMLFLSRHSSAQSVPMPGTPIFVGVPSFTGNISTDPFWYSTPNNSNGSYRSAVGDSDHHTNILGAPSYYLRPISVNGSQSDLYCWVPNHFAGPGNTNPLYHTIIFWRRGNWASGYGQLVITTSAGELFPRIYAGTTTEWVQETFIIPPSIGATIEVKFIAIKTGGFGSIGVNIDAIQIFPNLPNTAAISHTDTNFVVKFVPPASIEIMWNPLFYGQNYTLVASDTSNGTYLPISYTTNSASSGFIKTLLSTASPSRYYQMRR